MGAQFVRKIASQDQVMLNQAGRSKGLSSVLDCSSVGNDATSHTSMEVFAVTIFVSLMFAVLFAALFVAERSQRRRSSLEQDALLPLDDLRAAPVRKNDTTIPPHQSPL